MDIFTIRQQVKKMSIYEIPLRVTFYARVSTDSEEQMNSLGNQIDYYRNLISQNPAWTYVDGYVDEGLSGATTKKRENFHQMIDDARDGMFDLIVTKEISRFARNTLDSIQYTRELLRSGVCVFFQNDGINTIDEDSELRLTIMAGVAQDEIRKLSSRVRFGHAQAIKNGVVIGNSRIFGYKKDSGRLTIDESEAEMVRELFTLYATGEYSMKNLEDLFWEKGYRNLKGKKIAHNTMSGIISNPKYKGYYVGNKVKVVDMFTKKQVFLPPEEWVMFKDETGKIVPAIVSEELWDKANEVLKRRSDDVKNRKGICNHPNLLTGKLICTHCGVPYYRQDSKMADGTKHSKWICSCKHKNGSESCPSFAIYEREIKPILFDMFTSASTDIDSIIAEYLKMYRSVKRDGGLDKKIAELQDMIRVEEQKKQKLLTFNATGKLSDDEFLKMHAECQDKIRSATEEIEELSESLKSSQAEENRIEGIKKALVEAAKDAQKGAISKEFVDKYIDKIFVTPVDDKTMRLDIRIFTGEITSKQIRKQTKADTMRKRSLEQPSFGGENATRPTGNMFKKMIESYEKGMK